MRRDLLVLSTAAAFGTLLLTACGTQRTAGGPPGAVPAPSPGGASCTATASDPPTASSAPTAPAGSGSSAGASAGTDGVRLTGAAGCPVFEVTNTTGATATFTITFELVTDTGAAMDTAQQTVPSVRSGQTVRRPAERGGRQADTEGLGVRIIKVRSVPTAQAPSSAGPCPASGVYVYADDGDAAMGLRVVGVHLRNCGTRPYALDGYPRLELFDAGHRAVGAVRILHGADAVATGTGADGPPRPLVLGPGQGARAELVWRNTTGQGSDPVNAPYVRVVPKPGAPAVIVTPELDLGTTGKLAVGPWQSDEAERG